MLNFNCSWNIFFFWVGRGTEKSKKKSKKRREATHCLLEELEVC